MGGTEIEKSQLGITVGIKNSSERGSSASPNDDSEDDGILLRADVRPAAERSLVRKMDMRLLPTIILIFIMNYIDRTNVASARLKGLQEDLHLTDIQYNIVLAILYALYCPMQIPSNMFINRISRPSIYIGTSVIVWGMISTLTGVTHNFAGILLCRLFLGVPESVFYPGAFYMLSRWYTRKELAFRSALLYGGLLFSNAFGSLMAAGILSGLNGARGIAGWRWLYYIEGSITITIGFLAMRPHNTRWLSAPERRLAQVRMSEDAGGEVDRDVTTESVLNGFVQAIMDPKVLLLALATCSQLLGSSFVNFFPTSIDGDTWVRYHHQPAAGRVSFSASELWHLVLFVDETALRRPPWILGTIVTFLNSWHADKTGERYFHIVIPWFGMIIGYIIGVSTMVTGARYVAMFLLATGYAGLSLSLVWVANAVPRPPAKRAAAIGPVSGFGNIGTLIGSFVWPIKWGPEYHNSMYIGISAIVLSCLLCLAVRQMTIQDNNRLESSSMEMLKEENREKLEDAARLEGISVEEVVERRRGLTLSLYLSSDPQTCPITPQNMASLLERMNLDSPASSSGGPVRSRVKRNPSVPYNRPPKGDVNSTWQHDLYPGTSSNQNNNNTNSKSLVARLGQPTTVSPPKLNFGLADRALRDATGAKPAGGPLQIKGASNRGNVVDVSGLVAGTSAADVEAIFKRCGAITNSAVRNTQGGVTVRLTYKNEKDAKEAVTTFDGQVADGRTLVVKVVGGVNASLSGRLGVGLEDVDVLMQGESSGGSKMRSDDILTDADARARAHVLVAPPGADPKEYIQQPIRGRGRGGRGRRGGGGRRGGRGGEGRMDVD
ncbi:MFS general substrate transporter [Stereum hirsutum FP-91666 SS1]|uniref:MFS general substrate transporter n=1 Tax=Stereum hirsutum (strain FP-91666) TaxID=721885 RepID=UPI000444A796|nr:MFS general substrate transporter [Stereum hirsutum FP-91666 SS1]EIM85076.1 MFS general substrate transporter [Stereum hirsutum FP-91666 SS1]